MNRTTNGATTILQQTTPMDKSKDWQLELLMEKLRSKSSQLKSLTETAKSVRMAMLDKRYALDSVEKSQHQKCLDTLQHSIKVTSLQSMVERLECLTRQLGLKFVQGPSGVELFISSDMFYLEIILDQTGAVLDAKVHHENKVEQQVHELVSSLSKGDFADFTAQLEGFTSIYQLNAEKKMKCKAFTALQSLEADLSTLAQLQMFMKEPFNLLHKSPVGILEKRKGGHPVKLTYFVSPYDLLDPAKGDLEMMTVEGVTTKSLGYSVTVCMEGSAGHKLQTSTLITVNMNHNGKSTPSYAALTNQNSAIIPACFVLRLNKPMPMCAALVRQIQQITELDCAELSTTHPLLSLIATHSSEGKVDAGTNKGLFVTLPDQHHCYFMTENKNMDGVLLHSIPFSHPCHIAQILVILRQQALFNTIIASCIRPNSKQDFENMIMFEISALSWTHISISLEHPLEESMATAEIDLSDISNLICRIHSPGTPPPPNAPDAVTELATKVLNRCFSLPVTMRAVIKYWDKQVVRKNHYNGLENFNLALGSGDPGGRNGSSNATLSDFGNLEGKIKQEPSGNAGLGHGMSLMSHSHQAMFLNDSIMNSANFSSFPTSDNSSVLTNIELTNILTGGADKPKRQHKRKANEDLWKNAKRKPGDDSDLLDASSCDSTSRSTPLSQETCSEIQTPNSALGFHSDFEGLDPTEILGEKSAADFDGVDDLGDVEEILASTVTPKFCKKSPPSMNILGDLSDKSLVPPSVSITPISTTSQGINQNVARTGIEIIPINTSPVQSMPSSITITPIPSSQPKNEERPRDKKSSKNRSDDKGKVEKKRKKKREESPMGPPDKIPIKQDPLSKPVSVSIKPAGSPPSLNITPTSPSMIRKFTASPTQSRKISSGKLSPSLMSSGMKNASTAHHSPKHSPAHILSSPKHSIPGISSPKSHGMSPKHPSASGSGKPSMSTLKSAANSPSSKSVGDSGKNKSTGKESSRDKDKKISATFGTNSNKKSSSLKVKQLDLNAGLEVSNTVQDGLPSPSGSIDLTKSANSNQVRNRKGVGLLAVIDKLKSAQHCDGATDLSSKGKDRMGQVSGKTSDGSKTNKVGENKNSEYQVVKQPSSDGMKITINKKGTKDLKSNIIKPSSGTGSPKTHTGLKPGVNSGPASKKPQQLNQKTSSSNLSNSTSNSAYSNFKNASLNKLSLGNMKSGTNSSLNMSKALSKSSGSPKTGSATDLSRSKERPKLNKSGSIFSNREGRKGSPTQGRDETDGNYKLGLGKMDPYSTAPLMMEGLMKQLDKNFQIPKLSARSTDDKKLSNKINSGVSENLNNINRTVDTTKMFDMLTKNDIPKYTIPLPTSKIFDNNMEAKIRNSMNSMANSAISLTAANSSPKLTQNKDIRCDLTSDSGDEKKRDFPQNLSTGGGLGKDELNFKLYPISASKSFPPTANIEPLSLSTKSIDLTSKFLAPAPKDDKKDSKNKDISDNLLDFSSSKSDSKLSLLRGDGPPLPPSIAFPHSPSVSVHIVKSPAPSPLINPSPHSASPCITDDELMDEALGVLGK